MTNGEVHCLSISEGVIGKRQFHGPPLTSDRGQRRLIAEGRSNIARTYIGRSHGEGLGEWLEDYAGIDIAEVSIPCIQAIVTAAGITSGASGDDDGDDNPSGGGGANGGGASGDGGASALGW